MMQCFSGNRPLRERFGAADLPPREMRDLAQQLQECMQNVGNSKRPGAPVPSEQRMLGLLRSYFDGLDGAATIANADSLLRGIGLSYTAQTLLQTPEDELRQVPWRVTLLDLARRLREAAQSSDGFAVAPNGPQSRPLLDLLDEPEILLAPSVARASGLATRPVPPPELEEDRAPTFLPPEVRAFLAASPAPSESAAARQARLQATPSYTTPHGAPRPVPTYVPRTEDALACLAQAVEEGKPGGLLEAEAFAFMYNLPLRLWRRQGPGLPCMPVETLRQGDHNENYLSEPLNLVDCGDGWGVCDGDGRFFGQAKGPTESLYRALRDAARRSARPGLPCGMPGDLGAIRRDVAARLRGAPSRAIPRDRECQVAVGLLRDLALAYPVHIFRHDPDRGCDYLSPPLPTEAGPTAGLIHRAGEGWRVYVHLGPQGLGEAALEAALVPPDGDGPGTLAQALTYLLRLAGQRSETTQARLQEALASLAQPSVPTEGMLSEHYMEAARRRLEADFAAAGLDGQLSLSPQGARVLQMRQQGEAFCHAHPYRVFTAAAQEQGVKSYLAYLAEDKTFGAEISIAGMGTLLGRTARVWTTEGDGIALESSKVYGPPSSTPMDVYRVGAHYQVLSTERLAALGVAPEAMQAKIQRAQLRALTGRAPATQIEAALLDAQVALDVGGDGNCQFLVVAYQCNLLAFREIFDRHHNSNVQTGMAVRRCIADAPAHLMRDRVTALDFLCTRVSQELRAKLIEFWVQQLRQANHQSAPQVQALVAALAQAAHNEAGEVLGKAASADPSHSWTVGLAKQTPSTLRQRLALLRRVMAFCPSSDEALRDRGNQLIDAMQQELDRHQDKALPPPSAPVAPRGWSISPWGL